MDYSWTRSSPGWTARPSSSSFEPLVKSHRQPARQDLHGQRRGAGAGPVADRSSKNPSGDDVGLPMFLALEAGQRIIGGQKLQRPHPRVVSRIVGDERRDETRLQRHLSAGKAVATAPLEPLIGIIALIRPGAAEAQLKGFSGQ